MMSFHNDLINKQPGLISGSGMPGGARAYVFRGDLHESD